MLEFLTKLKTKQTETAINKHDEWLALVVAVADGDEPAEDAVLETLEHCGRTVEDLQAAVELVRQRREWTTQMATVPAARAEAAAIEASRKAARVELFDAQSKYNELNAALAMREQANIKTLSTAEAARQSLQGTSTDQSLTNRIHKAREGIKQIHAPLARLVERRGDRRHELTRVETSNDAGSGEVEAARKHATEHDAEINRLESEQHRLQAEIEAAYLEKLDIMAL